MLGIAFGTRPEYIKLKPIMEKFDGKKSFKVIFTGQHEHLVDALPPRYDVTRAKIIDGPNRLDSIVSSLMNLECFDGITHLMVQGDTSSAFTMALAAFHREIKIIHLEAGLRTYDLSNPYPEEANRQLISRIANIHFCPTHVDCDNLKKEKIFSNEIHMVGNTVLDNLVGVPINYNDDVIITMHRRENHQIIPEWFEEFEKLSLKYNNLNFKFISHPNPNVQKYLYLLKNVQVLDPMTHDEFIKELSSCSFVITDSGGLQEESSFLRKYSIVCRKTTERLAGIGTWSSLCRTPKRLNILVEKIVGNIYPPTNLECPYGDGHSAEKIYNLLYDMV